MKVPAKLLEAPLQELRRGPPAPSLLRKVIDPAYCGLLSYASLCSFLVASVLLSNESAPARRGGIIGLALGIVLLGVALRGAVKSTAAGRRSVAALEAYLERAIRKGSLPTVRSSLPLLSNEEALLECPAILLAVRSGDGPEPRDLDRGAAVLTTRRILFHGSREDRALPIARIRAIHPISRGMEVTTASPAKGFGLAGPDPFLWVALVNLVRKVDRGRRG